MSGHLNLKPPQNPGARVDFGMAEDPLTHQIVLFGGDLGSGGGNYADDTWIWDEATAHWAQWCPQCPVHPPAYRGWHMAFDGAQLVLFGAPPNSLGNPVPATWLWNGASWAASPAGPQPSPPSFGASGTMAFDPIRHEVVLLTSWPGHGALLATWTWNGTRWTQLSTPHPPTDSSFLVSAFDGQRVMLYSEDGDQILLWDGADWQTAPSSGQRPRLAFEMMAEAGPAGLLLHGAPLSHDSRAETWTWDGGTQTWTLHPEATAAGAPHPGGRYWGRTAYSSLTGTDLLFGGTCAPGPCTELGDAADATWEYRTSYPTVTALSSSPNSSRQAQHVVLTASVASSIPGSTLPTGSVTFDEGSSPLGPAVPLQPNGSATLSTALGVGAHVLTAVYSGDTTHPSSTSPPLTQTVLPNPSAPHIAHLNPDAGPIAGGTPVSINGTRLAGAGTISFGAAAVTVHPCPVPAPVRDPCFTAKSDSQLLAYSPAVPAAAVVPVSVTDPTTGSSNAVDYTYGAQVSPSVTPWSTAHVNAPAAGQNSLPPVTPSGGTGYGGGAGSGSGLTPPGISGGVGGSPALGSGSALPAPVVNGATSPTIAGLPRSTEGQTAAPQEAHEMVRHAAAGASAALAGGGTAAATGCVVLARRRPRPRVRCAG